MKKSIALFITIMFLFVVVGILGTILFYTQKMTKNDNFYIAENSILIKNALDTLNTISKDINTSDKLKMIFTSFPISSVNGDFRAVYTITPLYNKIDLNAYLQNGKINPHIDAFLDNVFDYYQIQDSQLLKDLILDTIDKDDIEREAYSEITLQNPNFQNGQIYNFNQFETIQKRYYQITQDKNIFKIPWKKLVFFGNGKSHIIECNLLDKLTAKFLGLQFDGNPTCKNILTEENKQIIDNFDIIEFKNKNDFLINIAIDYFYNELHNEINIIYDIHEKKAISIESHPVY
jgi:hypothetical protein